MVLADIEKATKRLNDGEKVKARYRLDEEQEANFKRRFKEEMWLEEMRLAMGKKFNKEDGKTTVFLKVKLPKLFITKFEGTAFGLVAFLEPVRDRF